MYESCFMFSQVDCTTIRTLLLVITLYISFLGGRQVLKEDGSGEYILLNLKKLLIFITGADHVPPLGFPSRPQIVFTNVPERTLPRA